MDIQQILQIGATLFKDKLGQAGGKLDMSLIIKALSGLLSNQSGKIDLSSIVSNLDANGLMSVAASWLGDGGNKSISADQIAKTFGSDKISSFASKLNLDEGTALEGLTEAIPGIVDKSSQGGNILDSVGGISDALGGLKGLFG
ncbi:MAG: hypothetical protein CR997_13310 [Acidobacteria bacterium]|nr:MAG: hypothetical protein CR997_13310 [Acidobacteriota bacterium]